MSNQTTSPKSVSTQRNKVTIPFLNQKKSTGAAITMLTAYDYTTARAVDQAGIDIILIGDSLGMVVLGYPNTLPVTMEDMLHHCKAVKRGAQYAMLIGDMPFMSYQVSKAEAVRNAGRFMQEAGMDAVKLEGGREREAAIRAIHAAGIPVMGHLGLTPQSVSQLGGFRPQGTYAHAAQEILRDAFVLQDAGCFSIVLESIPTQLAKWISDRLQIPTIGIGAGIGCDGQVLVVHDVLGLFDRFQPRFAKKYTDLYQQTVNAFHQYRNEVENRTFPTKEHSVEMSEGEWQAFLEVAARYQKDG